MIALLVFGVAMLLVFGVATAADAWATIRRPLRRIVQPVRAAVPALPARIRCDLARARAARARRARTRTTT
ncbi:hypothetical protein ADL35_12435 [Streptomyces sp. NRRL WC-3753]|nr:hypothetical protein ADL35_12435 [Streptomyces sp. NRRL WC-3753]